MLLTEKITKAEKQNLIEGYNALVADYLELGIGKAFYIDESYPITVEQLFMLQGVLVNKMANHIKIYQRWEAQTESISLLV